MSILLWLATALQFGSGVLVLAEAKSAIHQILGVLLIGFAGLEFGLVAILRELERHRLAQASPATATASPVAGLGQSVAPTYGQGTHRGTPFDYHTDHTVSAAIRGQRYTWPSEAEFRKWMDSHR